MINVSFYPLIKKIKYYIKGKLHFFFIKIKGKKNRKKKKLRSIKVPKPLGGK